MPEPNENHFGEVKKRYTVEGIVSAYREVEIYSQFASWMAIVEIVLDSGELVVYTGSKPPFGDQDFGKTVKFTATVKAHDEYGFQAQTKMQRFAKCEVMA